MDNYLVKQHEQKANLNVPGGQFCGTAGNIELFSPISIKNFALNCPILRLTRQIALLAIKKSNKNLSENVSSPYRKVW